MHPLGKVTLFTALIAITISLAGICVYPTVQSDSQGEAMAQQISQETKAAKGFGADQARVDSQITLMIPNGQAAEVYRYLKARYVAQNGLLQDQFPGMKLSGKQMSDVSVFTDLYFDTPALDLYRQSNSCRQRKRLNTTHPDDRKNGRELVQMKVTPKDNFTLRNELKYEVKPSTRRRTNDDVHPLLRQIDHNQRADFKQVYANAGVDAYALRLVLTIQQTRSRGYLDLDGKNILSFSVDEGGANLLWAKGGFASVDLGLVEVAYTEADEAMRKTMWAIRTAIIDDLRRQFPDLQQNTESKYSIVLAQLIQQIPLIPLLLRFRLL
ncbi:MAG: hypothetical protein EXS02_03235 [Planctomycetes bacterium]|nr:hypothetical protein [Planctomycetota bacterium]